MCAAPTRRRPRIGSSSASTRASGPTSATAMSIRASCTRTSRRLRAHPAPTSRTSASGKASRTSSIRFARTRLLRGRSPTARFSRSTSLDSIANVRHRRRLDYSCRLELDHRVEVLEEPDPAAQEPRDDVNLELVEQARGQTLLREGPAARSENVFVPRDLPCLRNGALNAVGDEYERRPTFQDQRLAGVVL